ncbi:MAG: UDP-N-acetylmuramoyl-L-alanyl-D-glutamate--2,6-diaminopimelate ligase [Ardenticatenales bacterium]|nr:UDP-N-acetylmuramoyl-L-alanyl-D-glutamate--2,6-diaminopimelate ligase [Ardenticatenales bacterium]
MSTQHPPHDAPARPLRDLLDDVDVLDIAGDLDVPIGRVTYDSRDCRAGTLFAAYRGVYQDVHGFLPDAFARGAVAALVERPIAELLATLAIPSGATLVRVADVRLARAQIAAAQHGHPGRAMRIVGVTGTDGKTTTSTLLHAILTAAGYRVGLLTTVAARIGDDELDTGLHVTTPEPEDLQAILARMRDAEVEIAVVETTSHGLVQHRVGAIRFDVGVLTNLTPEALEFHGTMDAYRDAKGLLFEKLVAAADGSAAADDLPPTAVLNADDPSYAHYATIPVARRLSYSRAGNPAADFRARDIESDITGIAFTADTPEGTVRIRSPQAGPYNVANILAAMAASHAFGAGPDDWRTAVAAVAGVPGRMERIDAGQPFTAIVDFAHTPNALDEALRAARGMVGDGGKVMCVFGCAGLRDPGKRPAMGHHAGRLADVTVITAEDPRTEDLDDILDAIAAGLREAGVVEVAGAATAAGGSIDARSVEGRPVGSTEGPPTSPSGHDVHVFVRCPDRYAAIAEACARAGAGDIVLVCGKGHEQSLCFGDVEYPWDDREAVRAAIGGRSSYGELPTSR